MTTENRAAPTVGRSQNNFRIKYIGNRQLLAFYELSAANKEAMRQEYGEKASDKLYYFNESMTLELFEFLRIENGENLKSFHGVTSDSYWTGSLCILGPGSETFKLFTYHVKG